MRFEPDEMLDLGDRLLFVGRVKAAARVAVLARSAA
jgi:hypothetical protein